MLRPHAVLRFLLYGVLAWLALTFLWLALPSPSPFDDGTNYPTSVINAGRRLTRVYEVDEFFPYRSDEYPPVPLARESGRHRFSLTFALDGGRENLTISNTKTISLALKLTEHVSDPIVIPAPTGDLDGVNPPWFNKADATLLYWMIHRDEVMITLRVRWTEKSAIEIWPDSLSWALPQPVPPAGISPLLTLIFAGGRRDIVAVTPAPARSSSPSYTYFLRVAILSVIAPTGLLVMTISMWLVEVFSSLVVILLESCLLLSAALVVAWILSGRQLDFREFVSQFFKNFRDSWDRIQDQILEGRGSGQERGSSSRDDEAAPNAGIDLEKHQA